jgi:hypothetical protein
VPTATRGNDKLDAAVASSFLILVFLIAWACGLLHYGAANLVTPAVILSGLAWLTASLIPVWIKAANMMAGLANGVAAAAATYAALCSLPAVKI